LGCQKETKTRHGEEKKEGVRILKRRRRRRMRLDKTHLG